VLVLRFLNIVGAAESALSVGVAMMLLGPERHFLGSRGPLFQLANILARKWPPCANLSSASSEVFE
jgi:hypothetical protein